MYCVIVTIKGWIGGDTSVFGPYESFWLAYKAMREVRANFIKMGFKAISVNCRIEKMNTLD